MNTEEIARIVGEQRAYFKTHATFDVDARRRASCACARPVPGHTSTILPMRSRPIWESRMTRHICARSAPRFPRFVISCACGRWSRPRLRPCDLANAISVCKTQAVPYGVTLIGALELSVFADARAARWRPCRRQYRGHQAERLCSGIQRSSQANL